MKNKDNIISAIDVGTTKIAVLIGNYDLQNSRFEILGFGESKSEGLKRGIVINISKTIDSIRSAVEKAESKAGISINSALVGISGEHIKGINGSSAININNPQGNNNPGQPITKSDKNRVIEQSQSINLSPDRRVLHVLSQNFVVDNNKDVKNPVGLSCQRLEANVHIVTVGKNSEMDLVSCMKEIGIEVVDKFIFEPLASAHSVLTVDERELGVVMLDIGGGTTDMIVYKNGGVVDISAIPIGGEAITKDIAIGLQLSMEEAEEIKKKHGSAKVALATDDELVSINQSFNINNKKISEKNIATIIEPRMRQIFEYINLELQKHISDTSLTFGLVITGGGSQLKNLTDLAQELFGVQTRIGIPNQSVLIKSIKNSKITLNTRYSTLLGLIDYGISTSNEKLFWPELQHVDKEDDTLSPIYKIFKKFIDSIS